MKHSYSISGMSCMGCVKSVTQALSNDPRILNVVVDLEKNKVDIEMSKHLDIHQLQSILDDAGLHYTFGQLGAKTPKSIPIKTKQATAGTGIYHCPMNCEGTKNYDQPGDCPVCGMDLIEQPKLTSTISEYTCPMHPEIIKDGPESCPICGMDLVSKTPVDSVENKQYKTLLRKFIIAVVFTLPIFIMAMSEMIPENPLVEVLDSNKQS